MPPFPARRPARLALCLLALLVLPACTGSDAAPPPPTATSTLTPLPTATSTPLPSATPVPASATPRLPTPVPPTQPPPSPAPATVAPQPTAPPQSGAIQFKPAQVEQGQATVAYFTLPAGAATLTFAGKQYPMVSDGARWWTVIGVGAIVTPGLYPVSVLYTPAAGGATMSVTGSVAVVPHSYPVENIELAPGQGSLLAADVVQAEINTRAQIFAGYTARRLWTGTFRNPSSGAPVTSIFGELRSYNGAPPTDYHRGTDFGLFTGDPVVAAADGRVVFAGELAVRGNSIYVDHGVGVFTGYHHLSAIEVAVGQEVRAGQRIGLAGMTGLAPAPHLHWELIVRGTEVDGLQWLRGEIAP